MDEIKMQYTLETKLNGEVIDQVLLLNKEDPVRREVEKVSRWLVDTREKGIREALITLGWTPPTSEQE